MRRVTLLHTSGFPQDRSGIVCVSIVIHEDSVRRIGLGLTIVKSSRIE